MSMNTTTLKLAEITFSQDLQVRAVISDATVEHYAERLIEEDLPPLIVYQVDDKYLLVDGYHRYRAAEKIKQTEFKCDIRTGTMEDAIWFAIGANRAHGLPLRGTDRRNAIVLALEKFPAKSEREIADQVGCSKTYVHKIKSESEGQVVTSDQVPPKVTGKDGKQYNKTKPKKPAASKPETKPSSPPPPTAKDPVPSSPPAPKPISDEPKDGPPKIVPITKDQHDAAQIEVEKLKAAYGPASDSVRFDFIVWVISTSTPVWKKMILEYFADARLSKAA
jgi:hypothetical protein